MGIEVCQGVSDPCIGGPQRWLVVAVIHTESCIFRCKYVYTCVKTTLLSSSPMPWSHPPAATHFDLEIIAMMLWFQDGGWKKMPFCRCFLLSFPGCLHGQNRKWHMVCGVLAKQNVSPWLRKKLPKISKHHWAPCKVHLRSGTVYHILKKWYVTNDAKYLNDESW